MIVNEQIEVNVERLTKVNEIDLLKRVCTVSVETMKIVREMEKA